MVKKPVKKKSTSTKKRKKVKSQKKKTFSAWRIILPVIIILCVCFFAIYVIKDVTVQQLVKPVYEDYKRLRAEQIIKDFDRAIYSSFYDLGISDNEIHFIDIHRETHDEMIWDIASLSVNTKKKPSIKKLEEVFSLHLKDIPDGAILVINSTKEGLLRLTLSNKGIKTHSIDIIYPFKKTSKIKKGVKTAAVKPVVAKHHKPLARLAIIIDDMGYNKEVGYGLIDLDIPLTFAFLPYSPFLNNLKKRAAERGRIIMLHMPMEPKKNANGANPGKGALLTGMNRDEIKKTFLNALRSVDGAVGVNNHMGSLFTEYESGVRDLLLSLKSKDLFVIDSLTSPDSAVYPIAKDMMVPALRRDIFLDNVQTEPAIQSQLDRLVSISLKRGWAIGIAHPYPKTLEVLKKNEKKFKKKGIEVVPVSMFLQSGRSSSN